MTQPLVINLLTKSLIIICLKILYKILDKMLDDILVMSHYCKNVLMSIIYDKHPFCHFVLQCYNFTWIKPNITKTYPNKPSILLTCYTTSFQQKLKRIKPNITKTYPNDPSFHLTWSDHSPNMFRSFFLPQFQNNQTQTNKNLSKRPFNSPTLQHSFFSLQYLK